ncbi:MAG TPA: hypothetical protein PK156_31665, partial [Polyangium sp.]|nr:hypothetical protein [Polyangium sp.]
QDPPPPPSPPGPPTAPTAPQKSLKDMGPDGCHVRVVVLPGDADVTIDGSPARRKDGAIELLGHRGDVVRMRVSKAGQFVETDVKLDTAGAIPPVVALPPKLPADRSKP